MSRCKACNAKLTDLELKRKYVFPNGKIEYADMCTRCLKVSDTSMFKIKDSRNPVENQQDYE